MANVLLPLQVGTVPQGFCFTSWQDAANMLRGVFEAVLPGMAFYNYGPDLPAPENQGYPWFRTVDGRWYYFTGNWISPANYDVNERRLYVGDTNALKTYDGGDTGAPGPTSGPMWEVDADFADRIPIGPGLIAAAPETNAGAAQHTLTEAEGAVGLHTHAVGKSSGNDDAQFIKTALTTVTPYTDWFVTGSGSGASGTDTQADLYTLAAANGAGVTSTPFDIIPPVRGVYIIKWTGRLYRKV